MQCPKCQAVTHEMKVEGVDLDFCSGCKGLWFDEDEVAFMLELPVDMPDLEKVKTGAKKTNLDCPRCGDKLEEMKFSKSNNLLVDRSPGCGGIWLDRTEYPKIEKIASTIGDVKSKIMMTCKYFKQNGYQILAAGFQK